MAALGTRPLPKALHDPLLTLKPWVLGMVILILIAAGIEIALFYLWEQPLVAASLGGTVAGAFIFLTFFVIAFPRRETNVLYLRSFRKDRESERIREFLEVAFGANYRISGIRDPKRRTRTLLRPIILGWMILRYAGARYLNLEAGNDWKARIWASFRHCRAVVVDLRDVTRFVRDEVALTLACLPPERILFVVGPDQDLAVWKKEICAMASPEALSDEALNFLVWRGNSREYRTDFMEAVSAFIRKLPPETAGLNWKAFSLIEETIADAKSIRNSRIRTALAWVGGLILVNLFAYFLTDLSGGSTQELFYKALALAAGFVGFAYLLTLAGKVRRLGVAMKFNKNYGGVLSGELLAASTLLLAAGLSFYYITIKPVVGAYEQSARRTQTAMTLRVMNLPVQEFLFINERLPRPGEMDLQDMRDAWDNAIVHRQAPDGSYLELVSPGPDEIPGSFDDIIMTIYGDGTSQLSGGSR